MKKSILVVMLFFLVPVCVAQSNGNFSASAVPATCSIGDEGVLGGGTQIHVWTANISTSNGKGVTLKITPSMVTGLFTRTKIDTNVSSASADMGIEVCIEVDGSSEGILPAPCVVYDQRFQQISSNLFSQLSECNSVICTTDSDCPTGSTCYNPSSAEQGGVCVVPTTDVCTADTDCGAGQICANPSGETDAGFCAQTGNPLCDFDMILSTLSAHSFDFVVPVGYGKPHTITATWSVIGDVSKPETAAACVGPGIVTVQQVKVFNNSGDLITIEEPPQ